MIVFERYRVVFSMIFNLGYGQYTHIARQDFSSVEILERYVLLFQRLRIVLGTCQHDVLVCNHKIRNRDILTSKFRIFSWGFYYISLLHKIPEAFFKNDKTKRIEENAAYVHQ